MLPDGAVYIVINGRTGNNTGLGTTVHGELIDIEARFFIHKKRAVCDHFVQCFSGFFINTIVIGIDRIVKLGFRTVNF